MPKAIVFRPADLPLFAPIAALVDPEGAQAHLAHVVYPSDDKERAEVLWSTPEPALAPELEADLLAIDATASDLFRDVVGVATGSSASYGFHAGLSPHEAYAALSRAGFDVEIWDGGSVACDESDGPDETWLAELAQTYIDGDSPRWPEPPPDPWLPLSPLFQRVVARGVVPARILHGAAFSGLGLAGSAPRGWLAAELLARSETWLDDLRAIEADAVADVVERLAVDTPARLFDLRCVKRGLARVAAADLTPRTLHRLFEVGARTAVEIAGLAEGRPSPVPASRAHIRDLEGCVAAMRGGGASPAMSGSGVTEGNYDPQAAHSDPRHTLRATDVAWSPSGDRVVVVADEVRLLRRATRDTGLGCESVAGRHHFEPLRDYPLIGKRKNDAANVVLSGHFDARGLLATGWRHGDLRVGPPDTEASGHDRVARFDEPVFRVRYAPRGNAIAAIVGTNLVLLPDGRTPQVLGPAWMGGEPGRTMSPTFYMAVDGVGAHLAWTPDGRQVAVCCDGDIHVYDAGGNPISTTRVAGDFEAHGGIGASERGFFVLTANDLIWLDLSGKIHRIPRAVTPAEEDAPGVVEPVKDGRTVVAWTMSGGSSRRTAHLELFDLDHARAHHVRIFAWNAPVPLVAVAPSRDVYAIATGGSLWLAPWTLSHVRDEAADICALGHALRKAGHLDEAKRVLETVSPRRAGIDRALLDVREALAASRPVVSPLAAPLPKSAPKAAPQAAGPDDLDVDHVVTHARFGRGVVVDIDGLGKATRVTVDFDGTERVLPASSLRRSD